MKITNIETFFTQPRWMFVKVSTDEGICGFGECITAGGRAKTIAMAIEEMKEHLVGTSPLSIENIYQKMYINTFFKGGPVFMIALSGIEQALFDIKGKFYNIPVYEFLGGKVRDKIKMYRHCNADTPEEIVAKALKSRELGYKAVKLVINPPANIIGDNSYVKLQCRKMEALRKALGDDFDIALDFHGRMIPALANIVIEALTQYKPMFIEEPCQPENVDEMADIARRTNLPVASGERLSTIYQFRELLEKRAVSIVQPDICHAGGIWESKKISVLAQAHYAAFAPHNPIGPVSLASCIQLDATVPNFVIQEHVGYDNKWDMGQGFLKEPFVLEDGYITVPSKPGLGIEFNEEAFEKYEHIGTRVLPQISREDGTITDW